MLTNLPNASIWAEPCLMNVESRRINGVTFPLRSHRGGASRQGKRAQYGSGMGPLASRTSKRTDNIWKTYGINSVISCCKMPWNTGKRASSKELTAVASAWQTILRYERKEFVSTEFTKFSTLPLLDRQRQCFKEIMIEQGTRWVLRDECENLCQAWKCYCHVGHSSGLQHMKAAHDGCKYKKLIDKAKSSIEMTFPSLTLHNILVLRRSRQRKRCKESANQLIRVRSKYLWAKQECITCITHGQYLFQRTGRVTVHHNALRGQMAYQLWQAASQGLWSQKTTEDHHIFNGSCLQHGQLIYCEKEESYD